MSALVSCHACLVETNGNLWSRCASDNGTCLSMHFPPCSNFVSPCICSHVVCALSHPPIPTLLFFFVRSSLFLFFPLLFFLSAFLPSSALIQERIAANRLFGGTAGQQRAEKLAAATQVAVPDKDKDEPKQLTEEQKQTIKVRGSSTRVVVVWCSQRKQH